MKSFWAFMAVFSHNIYFIALNRSLSSSLQHFENLNQSSCILMIFIWEKQFLCRIVDLCDVLDWLLGKVDLAEFADLE